jgi:recombinational DNA repair protein (RecF pathway)
VLHHAGEEPSAALFGGLDASLDRLAEAPPEMVAVLVLSSAWALVSLMGYAPELGVCVECGEELDDDAVSRLDYAAGGVRCPRCAGSASEAPRIGPRAREQLGALLLGEPVDGLDRVAQHLRVLRNYVHHHISGSRPLPSFPFLESVVGEAV